MCTVGAAACRAVPVRGERRTWVRAFTEAGDMSTVEGFCPFLSADGRS